MVQLKVRYHCGCGFKTDNQEGAIEHCESEGHIIPVLGYVVPGVDPNESKETSNDQTEDKE